MSGGYWESVSIFLGINALVALSVYVPLAAGLISLGQGGFMAIGAYASAVMTRAGWPFAASLAAGALLAAAAGLLVSAPALRVRGMYLMILTLGFGEIVRVFFLNFEPTGGPSGLGGIPPLTGLPSLALACAVVLLVLFRLRHSRLGRAMIAVHEDDLAAAAMGINLLRVKLTAFALGALIAGLAGGFYAHQALFIDANQFDFSQSALAFLYVVLGGPATPLGPVVGAAVLTLVPELLRFVQEWRMTFVGALLVVVAIWRPGGIVPATRWRSTRASKRLDRLRQAPIAPSPRSSGERVGVRGLLGTDVRTPSPHPSPLRGEGADPVGGHRCDPIPAKSPLKPVLLELRAVSKRFGGYLALDDVSCAVARGSIHALIGPNGAGKTTLFNVICGAFLPTGGRLLFDGTDYTGRRPDRVAAMGIARNFQQVRLFPGLSVVENIAIGRHCRSGGNAWPTLLRLGFFERDAEREARARAAQLLELLGIRSKADERPSELTLVDQRRLEIARALASEPRLLLLDEPAAGMNAAEVVELEALIRRIRSGGVTVLVVEHNMRLVMSAAERVTVLSAGRVIADGSPAEVQRDAGVVAAYLGGAA